MTKKDDSHTLSTMKKIRGPFLNNLHTITAGMTILVTNDDSLSSPGIRSLARAASRIDSARIVAPRHPKSGIAKAMTFHKMMRAKDSKMEFDGRSVPATAITGTPADCVLFAVTNFREKFSLVAAGVNPGDNTSYHSILTSGTMGACFEAALLGIPAISFSIQSDPKKWFDHGGFTLSSAVEELVEEIIRKAYERGFPGGTKVIAVNIPIGYTRGVPVKVRRPQMLRIENNVIWEKDPLGNDIFWLSGSEACDMEKNSDCWELLKKGNVVITPLNLNIYADEDVEYLEEWFR